MTSLLPASSGLFETTLEASFDLGGIIKPALDEIVGLKYARPLNGTVAPWLVIEYGLGPIADYFATIEDLIDTGRVWQKIRGTPAALTTALSWIDYDALSIEDQVRNRRRWQLYQIDMGELPGDDEDKRLFDAEYLASLSDPARSEFYRGYHGYDVREMSLGNSGWGNAIWGDVSGVRINDGDVKWSHGRSHAVTIDAEFSDWDLFGWDDRIETGEGWPEMPWEMPGITWEGVIDYDAARSWLVLRKQAHIKFMDGDGQPIGYARVIRTPVQNVADAGTISVTYTVHTGFGDGAGDVAASLAVVFDIDHAEGVKPFKAWLSPDEAITDASFAPDTVSYDLSFRKTVRELVAVTLNLQAA